MEKCAFDCIFAASIHTIINSDMKIRLFLLFFFLCTTLSAQRALFPDSVGNINSVPIRGIDETDPYLRQFSLSCTSKLDNEPLVLTPDNAIGYQLSSRGMYVSHTFEYAGETRHLFLHRVGTYQDSLFFYVYYDDEAARYPIYYVQKNGEKQLYPLADDPATGYVSPLHSLLLSYPIAQDPDVRAYFDHLPPTPEAFKDAHRLAKSGYASHLPRFKWGVFLALPLTKVTAEGYMMDLAVSVVPGVFADIPFSFGLSYHPELTFEKYAANGSIDSEAALYSDVAYNVTSLSLPQMLRYTSITRPSRLLPYFELGAQASFNMTHSMEYRYFRNNFLDYLDYSNAINFLKEENGEESIPAVSFAILAGFGVEWQYSHRHSIYFSGRFIRELGHIGRIGGMLQVSYNL